MARAAKTLNSAALDAQSAAKIAAFASLLRANGFAVGLAESRDALAVLASPAGRRAALLKPALRALFSATREDWRRFDELFDAFWRGTGMRRIQPLRGADATSAARRKPLPSGFAPEAPNGGKESGDRDDEAGGRSGSGDRRDAASSAEALASRDIRHIADPQEMAKVHALAERLARRMRARLVRRWRARRGGPRLDLRRTIHRSVAHGGTPIDLVWRRRKLRPLRLVLLLDASGSMELYTAFFAREAFVLATVVRTVAATAAKAGAKAIIRADGSISEGWIGGGCARGAVLKAAREALADGRARLISVQPPDVLQAHGVAAGEEREGVRFAKNTCPSQGTMDIFIEPVLPRPQIVLCGSSPVAVAIAALAPRLGFSVATCAPAAEQDAFAEVDLRIDDYALPATAEGERFIVVSTQSRGDERALTAALTTNARYVAFVGSRLKAQTLKAALAARGLDPERLAGLRAPAGLDLGAIGPEEIALSIIAEIVAFRRGRDPRGQQP